MLYFCIIFNKLRHVASSSYKSKGKYKVGYVNTKYMFNYFSCPSIQITQSNNSFPIWLRNQLITAGLEPVLSHT